MWGVGGGRRRDGVGEEWGWGVVGSLYSAEKLPERCHLAASNNEGHFPNQRELAGSHGFFKDLVHYGLWHYLCVNSDRQPYPEGNLNGLCFSPPTSRSASRHIIHTPRWRFVRQSPRQRDQKRDTTQGRFSAVNGCQSADPGVTQVAKTFPHQHAFIHECKQKFWLL